MTSLTSRLVAPLLDPSCVTQKESKTQNKTAPQNPGDKKGTKASCPWDVTRPFPPRSLFTVSLDGPSERETTRSLLGGGGVYMTLLKFKLENY